MIWPILFMLGIYLVIGWVVLILFNIGQIKKYGSIQTGSDSVPAQVIMIFWPIVCVVMFFYHTAKIADRIVNVWYQWAADKKAAKMIKEGAARRVAAELQKEAEAAKLLNENNFERDDTTNFKSGIDR